MIYLNNINIQENFKLSRSYWEVFGDPSTLWWLEDSGVRNSSSFSRKIHHPRLRSSLPQGRSQGSRSLTLILKGRGVIPLIFPFGFQPESSRLPPVSSHLLPLNITPLGVTRSPRSPRFHDWPPPRYRSEFPPWKYLWCPSTCPIILPGQAQMTVVSPWWNKWRWNHGLFHQKNGEEIYRWRLVVTTIYSACKGFEKTAEGCFRFLTHCTSVVF